MNNNVQIHNKPSPIAVSPELLRDFNTLESLGFLQTILNSNPYITAIINLQKQIVLSNERLVQVAGLEKLDQMIGGRPGEILNCLRVADGSTCTTSTGCRFCGINNTISQSQKTSLRVDNDCRISTQVDGKLISYDFKVICTPLFLNEVHYTLMTLVDISSVKRNEMLEKVFFHDLLNRLGGVSGIIQVIKSENKQPELEEFIDLLDTFGEMVIEDIQTQRYLKAAEDTNLILNIRDHSAYELINSVHKQISFHPAMRSKKMVNCSECVDFTFQTDGSLLKRILLNMVKNAAEATPENGTIEVTCRSKPGWAVFSVQNDGVIPYEIQQQIFQRSFSTKGTGRGLGTYSMKLFGENYLKGRVYFVSDEKNNTVFTIELPLK